jgi:hypothetical protein
MTSHTMMTRNKLYLARRTTVKNILQYHGGIKQRVVTRSISKKLTEHLYPNYVSGFLHSSLTKKPSVFFYNSLWIMI